MTAKQILSLARLLYIFKLRGLGWTHRAIGVYMSCTDGKQQVRRMSRQMGLKVRDLNAVGMGYSEALKVALRVLAHHDEDCVDLSGGPPSLRDAAAAFLKAARNAGTILSVVMLSFMPLPKPKGDCPMRACKCVKMARAFRDERCRYLGGRTIAITA